jgi:hypothetical protein
MAPTILPWNLSGSFTMSLFTEATHCRTNAWQMLGFIHQLPKWLAENVALLHPDTNVNNYHKQLNVILHGIAEVQYGIDQRLTNVTLTINDHNFKSQLVCPIICAITNTPATNIICGHFNSTSSKIARLHCPCDCPHNQLNNADRVCVFMHAKKLFELMTAGTPAELKQLSVKPVTTNYAFAKLHVGDPIRNIFGATLTNIMHAIWQGTLSWSNHLLFGCLTVKGKKASDK